MVPFGFFFKHGTMYSVGSRGKYGVGLSNLNDGWLVFRIRLVAD